MNSNTSRSRLTPTKIAPVLVCLLGILACITDPSGRDVPRERWWDGDGIIVPHDDFPADCSLCHVGDGWFEIREDFEFDHLAETGVPLDGAHAEARCLRCHNDRGPVERFASQGCQGCHEDVHEGLLGQGCNDCHGQGEWVLRDEIALHNRTRFPLVGAHAAAACWTCHPGGEVGNWSRVDTACGSCHLDEAMSTSWPDHNALGWTRDCDRCHVPTIWTGRGFNHATFPLTGAHRGADCAGCHTGNAFVGLPSDCAGCHLEDFNQAADPDHVSGGFPTTCELCHDTSSWEGAMFSHAGISNGCHVCHVADYDGAPDHVANGYSTECEICHTTSAWQGADFEHRGISNGCLLCHSDDYDGAEDHVANGYSTDCENCHNTDDWDGANFSHGGIADGCVLCHLEDYNNTTDPNHATSGIPTACEQCHGTGSWQGAGFDHDGITNGCVTCHLEDYNGSTDPDHQASNLPTTCEQCHDTDRWQGATMDHNGITNGCVVCHLDDYNGTTDPNHQAANLPTTCESCHDTNSWLGATIDHNGITNGCVVCHLDDYNQTSDPNHQNAGFPTICELCHVTNTWQGADFDHDFPINSGDHSGFDCSDCHLQSQNYSSFSCIDCHEHNQGDMDDEHDGEGGYVWNSNACYNCHPDGSD